MSQRGTWSVAGLAVAAVLAGCAAPAPARVVVTATPSYAPAPCPNPVVPGFPQLDIPGGVECGVLTVPENRAATDGRTIRLPVFRAKATAPDPAPDPLVYLTGGPGGSSTISVGAKIAAGWNATRDVIFLEQRGSYKAEPVLSCPEIDTFAAEWVGSDTLDPATARRSADAVGACHDRLAANADLAAYNTSENSADVADLRTALGIAEWNLYGASYGSDLALQTLRDHPEGIRSVVVDSIVPPQQTPRLMWPSVASALDAVFRGCTAQPACQAAYPTLRADFLALVTDLAANPRTVTTPEGTVVVDGYKVANVLAKATTAPGAAAEIPRIVENLARGDGALAAALLLDGGAPPGFTGYGLTYGVFCREFTGAADDLLEGGRTVFPELPAEVLSLVPQSPYVFADCARWPVPAAPASVRTPVASDRPVLVMDGALDALTAPANGDLVARTLPNAVRVTLPDAGHDVTNWSPQCALDVIQGFLDRPDAPDLGCVARLATPTFTVG
ncbi:alpha/beta fold hydrolase [Pseudonocardia charpentierae]|uniref:Alpha/beta fold hydrolase n=1 Tax=Pseudonocardia charpentierae TaxID=3075545 RepID=A0ABU2NJ45_9PSEU|nr:alpha/beta fold hydrolase [Pseudonocardia sp. DSM 45834]MDT0353048.1 alpha/beta fold hydrolase [Pseudonocardia sp. DSM 45834]